MDFNSALKKRLRGASFIEVLVSLFLLSMATTGAMRMHVMVGDSVRQNLAATVAMFTTNDDAENRIAETLGASVIAALPPDKPVSEPEAE